MSILIPTPDNDLFQTNWSGRPSATMGTLVTAGGTAHTLGSSFTQLIASTSFDTEWVEIICHGVQTAATDSRALLNIYVGAAGQEQILIPNLLANGGTIAATACIPKVYRFPLRIPMGSRISAKSQALIVSDAVYVIINLHGGSQLDGWVGSGVEAIGVSAAASAGTGITPGTTSDGTFTSLGTTVNELRYIYVQHGGPNAADTTQNAGATSIELGAGSTLIPGLDLFLANLETNESSSMMNAMGRWRVIPAGTALQARLRFSGTAEVQYVAVYGCY
jgi:hypothetical protein